jgi:hypothetical protein
MDIRPPERIAPEPARKKPRDRLLMRTAAWGVCAALAVAVLFVAAQGPAASKRIERALSGVDETPAPRLVVADATQEHQRSIKSLQSKINDLVRDRDRLAARIVALEHNLEDVTGSIAKRDAAAHEPVAKPAPPAVIAAVEPEPPGPAEPSVPALLPRGPIVLDPLATPPAGLASILPETPGQRETRSEAEPAAPEKVAALTPTEPTKRTAPHQHPEYGIELATAPTMAQLRQRWVSAKANFGPLLVGLSPVAVRDRHPGSTAVRLVAGPVPSIIAARKLCARFAELKGNCWPARIEPGDIVR